MTNKTAEALRSRSRKIVSIEDPDNKEIKYEFKIRSLSTFELADHSNTFDNLPKEGITLNKDMPEESYKAMKEVILPMMKIFLPMCTMEPKITFNIKEESEDTVHIGDIPPMVSSLLFKEILDLSGITKAAEEERKKKLAEKEPPTTT